MSKTETEQLERRRKVHHLALETLAATVGCKTPGLKLWRQLRLLENRVYAACEAYSNDASFGIERWEKAKDDARIELARIFGGRIPAGVYVNGDPRGHMLKVDGDDRTLPDGMEKDWGNNGILAAMIEKEAA